MIPDERPQAECILKVALLLKGVLTFLDCFASSMHIGSGGEVTPAWLALH